MRIAAQHHGNLATKQAHGNESVCLQVASSESLSQENFADNETEGWSLERRCRARGCAASEKESKNKTHDQHAESRPSGAFLKAAADRFHFGSTEFC